MKYPKYLYQSATDMLRYEFISEGIKGQIKKMVELDKDIDKLY